MLIYEGGIITRGLRIDRCEISEGIGIWYCLAAAGFASLVPQMATQTDSCREERLLRRCSRRGSCQNRCQRRQVVGCVGGGGGGRGRRLWHVIALDGKADGKLEVDEVRWAVLHLVAHAFAVGFLLGIDVGLQGVAAGLVGVCAGDGNVRGAWNSLVGRAESVVVGIPERAVGLGVEPTAEELPLDVGVPVVLDLIVCSPWQPSCYERPSVVIGKKL
ncbi:hypothetical protein ACLOJK_031185 [Asimina triloba]